MGFLVLPQLTRGKDTKPFNLMHMLSMTLLRLQHHRRKKKWWSICWQPERSEMKRKAWKKKKLKRFFFFFSNEVLLLKQSGSWLVIWSEIPELIQTDRCPESVSLLSFFSFWLWPFIFSPVWRPQISIIQKFQYTNSADNQNIKHALIPQHRRISIVVNIKLKKKQKNKSKQRKLSKRLNIV